MKKRSISLIIGFMGAALLGVMAMQLYFLVQSYHLQSKIFDGLVNDALNKVVEKIPKQSANKFLKERIKSLDAKVNGDESAYGYKDDTSAKLPHIVKKKTSMRDSLKHVRNRLTNELADTGEEGSFTFRIRFENYIDEYGNLKQRGINEIVKNPANYIDPSKLHRFDTVKYLSLDDPQFGRQILTKVQENPFWRAEQERKQHIKQLKAVKRLLAQDSLEEIKTGNNRALFENIADDYQKANESLKNRLDPLLIDSLLRFELHNEGITLPFSYEVSTANNDSLIFSKASDQTGEKPVFTFANAPYHMPIFGKDVVNDPGMLRLAFPEKSRFILSGMVANMATSGGLMLVLILCFSYTIFSILRQKKISEMKTDFINNMTHEFKTPVSTIMIASEALKDDEVIADKSRISRLANIIYEENARLGSHIERVLNIARIEKDDFKLDVIPVNVNDAITAVVDSMALKLQKYNAQLHLHIDAASSSINADELHFSNVIYNLIDNAIKYSTGAPHITISTANAKNTLVITIVDKGIGMSREEQARIFEQFYRIPTGNLHDVKGFGLGLSYVNTIVKRLNGTISVWSEKDKGSEFELRFPVV